MITDLIAEVYKYNLLNYYSDIEAFDENVDFRVKDIKQSDKVFKDFLIITKNILNLILKLTK